MTTISVAQVSIGDDDRGTLSGTFFTDYYWLASSHNDELENSNGFWFRRIYLTHEYQISDAFSTRLRLDMASEGDFVSDAKLSPTVKDAYLRWSNDTHSITAGITGTPTWGLVEDVWGYRSVEKSPLDLFGFGSSREFGIAFKGELGAEGRLNYNFMIGNGNGRSSEIDKGKKLMLSLGYELTDHLVVEGYADWQDRPGRSDRYTAQGFVGYRSDGLNLGALYAYQFRQNTAFAGDRNLDLVSLFMNAKTGPTTAVFARIDHLFDQNPAGPDNDYLPMSAEAEPTFATAGVDVALHPQVHLMPNIETVFYGETESGATPDPEVIPRLTLFFSF